MPRAKKRKAAEAEYDDPMEFINMYCERRGIAREYGNSPMEKECQMYAQQAREEYKSRRDGKNDRNDSIDRKGLSPAEKYTIRLQNNRKSADASKVYNEVLKREQAHRMATLADAHSLVSDVKPMMYQSQQRTINALQREIEELKKENERLNGTLKYEKIRGNKLHKQVQEFQQQQFQQHVRSQQGQHMQMQHPSMSHPMPQMSHPMSQPGQHHMAQPHQQTHGQQPIHPPHQLSQPQSQPQLTPNQESQPQTESQQQQENIPPQQPSLHQRLVQSRGVLQPWSLSPVHNESDAKDFHTGLTCSQSQNEDTDEKGQLVRSSLPLSSGLQIGLLGSQPSQSDIPGFKSSIGSEELPIPPETEFFSLGSQGTTKGRPS